MSKDVATPKKEGGGGYTFEDKVSASFLLAMLAGDPPLHVDAGIIESVRFQKRVEGWYLDDLVLVLNGVDGRSSAVAVSIKSNAQLTTSGFPADFTKTVWEQRLHESTDAFDASRDYLVLATATVGNTVS
jgi:hypothetical protein